MQGLQRDQCTHTKVAGDSTASSGDCSPRANADESLEYLDQMIAQIGKLASLAGHGRLALILELANDETHALLQKRRARQSEGFNQGP